MGIFLISNYSYKGSYHTRLLPPSAPPSASSSVRLDDKNRITSRFSLGPLDAVTIFLLAAWLNGSMTGRSECARAPQISGRTPVHLRPSPFDRARSETSYKPCKTTRLLLRPSVRFCCWLNRVRSFQRLHSFLTAWFIHLRWMR